MRAYSHPQLTLLVLLALIGLFPALAKAAATRPIIVSTPNSTRAVALDAVNFTPEPFAPRSTSFLYGADRSTRVMVFVLNLTLQPGESATSVTCDAEDAAHHHYSLAVEFVGGVQGPDWLTAVVLRLDQDMGDLGDVLIRLSYQSVVSNRVRLGIGHVGDGPADDPNAGPTPAPPYALSGRVTWAGAGLSGVSINLSGAASAGATTDANGMFSFVVTSAGDYSVTATKRFFTFAPIFLNTLANSQSLNLTPIRDAYSIGGVAEDDSGNGMGGILVKLESVAGGPPARLITTGVDGTFSFQDVPAGYDYAVTPTNTNLVAFHQQTIGALEQNSSLTFEGTLRNYSISGFVSDRDQHGVAGATITLTGAANGITTTDANGNYSFNNLLAGHSYSVSAAKQDYFVSPGPQGFTMLEDEQANFSAIRFYTISGAVRTNEGRGVKGVLISLAGPETGTMRTPGDGSYSFTVTTPGDYVLTPSREQNLYQFSPAAKNLPNLSDHQTINFAGNIVINSPVYVLEFDGSPMSVDYSVFWPTDTNVGLFYWEFWARPTANDEDRYMLSDGYGGAHALLFGLDYSEEGTTHLSLSGNVWNGQRNVSFKSDEGPAPNEWGHYAVGWDGQNIIMYYDGVPVGKQAFTGPRVSTGFYNGSTMLLIGGSNHQNFEGRIAQVRGFEDTNPRANAPETSFAPATVFPVDGQLLSYYFKPDQYVADLSDGYRGAQHNGWPRGMLQFYFSGCDGCPTPRFVIDPTAPDFSNPANPGRASTFIPPPATPPAGALVFDSFSRDNSTYILNGKGGIGVTETGARAWQTNVNPTQPQPFGILGGRVVSLTDAGALAWVDVPGSSANLDIRVNRSFGKFGSGRDTGLCFRVIDKDNYFFAYSTDNPANTLEYRTLTVGYVQAGVSTILASGLPLPSSDAFPDEVHWYTLRVVTQESGAITVYVANQLIYSTNNPFAANAKGAGLFNCCAGKGLKNRWDAFTVLPAP